MAELAQSAPAPVIRLMPIRTLVISRDLAFRQRAVTVLGDLGVAAFAFASLELADEVVALVTRERPNVVVLDTVGCAGAVDRVVYELYTASPRVGIVLVGCRGDRAFRLHTLDKWGWAEELVRAVQAAYHCGNPLKEESAHAHQQPC
jgi:hypothetical protein